MTGIENNNIVVFVFTVLIHYFCIVLCHSSHRHDTSTPPLTIAGMIWDGACNFVQAMPRYLHKIERLDKLASVPRKVGGRNAQFCVCASLVWTRLKARKLTRFNLVSWKLLCALIGSFVYDGPRRQEHKQNTAIGRTRLVRLTICTIITSQILLALAIDIMWFLKK